MKSLPLLFRLIVAFAGTALIALATLATRLGIDHNTEWGTSRRLIFTIGWVALTAGLWPHLRRAWHILEQRFGPHAQRVEAGFERTLLGARITRAVRALHTWLGSAPVPDIASPSRLRLAAALTTAAVLLTEIVYVFIVSVGSWADWPKETEYYTLLSQAFRAGQLHLPVEPDPALVALDNPYDFAARGDIPILWDSSFYNGKYYLYYGPTPALFLAAAESLTGKHFGDQYLVFAFVTLINVVLAWMLFYLWRKLFPATSPWLLGILVAAAGLTNPLPWLLAWPAFYEAAIASGTAFLLLGLALTLPEWVEGRVSTVRLAFASICWALAAGSRVALVPSVLVPLAWLVLRFVYHRPRRWAAIAAVLLPLLAGALAHAWYNYARFHDLLETGFHYGLTTFDQVAQADKMFAFSYVPSNLFNYLWMPARWLSVFPFVKAQWGIESVPVIGLNPGGLYGTEQVSGIFRVIPLAWVALAAILVLRRSSHGRENPRASVSLSLVFGSSFFAGLLSLVAYHAVAMRYEIQFVPQLFLLATLGGWTAINYLSVHRGWWLAASVGLAALAMRGLVLGLLLAFSSHYGRFEVLDPRLFDALTRLFAW